MEPFGGNSHAPEQLVGHAQIVRERIRTLEVGVEICQRDLAEIRRYIGEIDLTSGGLVNTTWRALGDVIAIQIRPCGGGLNG